MMAAASTSRKMAAPTMTTMPNGVSANKSIDRSFWALTAEPVSLKTELRLSSKPDLS
jgi:hypothetical protein